MNVGEIKEEELEHMIKLANAIGREVFEEISERECPTRAILIKIITAEMILMNEMMNLVHYNPKNGAQTFDAIHKNIQRILIDRQEKFKGGKGATGAN